MNFHSITTMTAIINAVRLWKVYCCHHKNIVWVFTFTYFRQSLLSTQTYCSCVDVYTFSAVYFVTINIFKFCLRVHFLGSLYCHHQHIKVVFTCTISRQSLLSLSCHSLFLPQTYLSLVNVYTSPLSASSYAPGPARVTQQKELVQHNMFPYWCNSL